jgi:hypothetical protein
MSIYTEPRSVSDLKECEGNFDIARATPFFPRKAMAKTWKHQLLHTLTEHGRIQRESVLGYISDLPEEGAGAIWFAGAQHALAPRLLMPHQNP